jgi:hypothetical protein
MTIVVATAAPDGLVLAADGRTTLVNGRRHRIASDHTRKVFAPFNGIGVATFGVALLADQTIAGHMEKFAAQPFQDPVTVDSVSHAISKYFTRLLDEQAEAIGRRPPDGVLGFVVAGYDALGVGQIYDVLLPAAEAGPGPVLPRADPSTRLPGYLFRGRTQHARRLFEGFDVDGLGRSGAKPSARVRHELQRLGYHMNQPLSVQEAVDLAVFIVRLTVDMDRLSDGTFAEPEAVPICGGALQVLVITSKGFNWIVQPRLRATVAGTAEAG